MTVTFAGTTVSSSRSFDASHIVRNGTIDPAIATTSYAAGYAVGFTEGYHSQSIGVLNSMTASPVTKWEPIQAVVTIDATLRLFIEYVGGGNRFAIYDADEFTGFFGERSLVTTAAGPPTTSPGGGSRPTVEYTITLLPNGGWWTSQFTIKFLAGNELSSTLFSVIESS